MKKRISISSNKPVIVTMGDPRGIGAEIIGKALKIPSLYKQASFQVIGDQKLLKGLDSSIKVLHVPYKEPGEGALKFLDHAIALIKQGPARALVTAPLSKEEVSRYRKNFVGHTEYLAQAFNVKRFDMMFVAGDMRLTIATRHVPLHKVPGLITQQLVFDSIVLMAETLIKQFKMKSPKIAVLGLNPHAGEGGLLGQEEIKEIFPAIKKAQSKGIKVQGPFPADTFFSFGHTFDGTIAMYHDQGLAPIKGMYMKKLVNFTAGLPFVRTSPAHGTAFDIVGKNKADPSSMSAAIQLACELS